MKTCSVCKESKPTSEFNRHSAHRDGLQSACRPCNLAQVTAWQRKNRDYYLDYQRRLVGGQRFWKAIRSGPAVHVRTEDELRMALQDPYPFYAEPS